MSKSVSLAASQASGGAELLDVIERFTGRLLGLRSISDIFIVEFSLVVSARAHKIITKRQCVCN